MTKILEKIINHCDIDCPYYDYQEYYISCAHDDGGTICNSKDFYVLKEIPFGPKKYNLKRQELVINEDLFPISPPQWCPLKDVKDKGVKVGAAAIFIKNGKVLMGKRKGDILMANQFAFPGGKMNLFEDSLIEGLKREVQEETGIILKEADLICFQNENFTEVYKNFIIFYYIAKEWEGEPINLEPEKCEGWEWVNINNLPENTSMHALKAIKEYYKIL